MSRLTGPQGRPQVTAPGWPGGAERRQTGVDGGCRVCWYDPCTCHVARVDAYITLIPVYPRNLRPAHPRVPLPAGGTLEVVSVFGFPGELDEAVDEALAGWVEQFTRRGVIPDNGSDFRSLSGVAVIRRTGKRSWRCRADCFEVETESGESSGGCVLSWRPT